MSRPEGARFPDLLSMSEAEFSDFYESQGAYNRNEGEGILLIDAKSDREALLIFLSRIQSRSSHTYRSYKKELDRLLLWCLFVAQKPLVGLSVEDVQDFLTFLSDPIESWVGPRKPRAHAEFRPMEGPLSSASIRQSLQIVSSCFGFLVDAGYARVNPCKLILRNEVKSAPERAKVERFLERDVWEEFWHFLEGLPHETPEEAKEYERARFLFSLLYLQAPRVSEVAQAKMGDVIRQNGRWWWRILGKGNKMARVPVHAEMLSALRRYRVSLGLSPLPSEGEELPLVFPLRGRKPLSPDMVYRLVKRYVRLGAEALGGYFPEAKMRLLRASTHWFRHTSLTHQAEAGVDIQYLKENARHGSIQTTQRYIHADEQKFHDALGAHHLLEHTKKEAE